MSDMDMYAARTQRHITLVLLYGLFSLIILLIVASFIPYKVDDKLSGMVSALVDGILSLTSGAVGYWIARHRPNDADTGKPANPTTAATPLPHGVMSP